MKLTDILVSAIIKRGVLFEARNVDTQFDIPVSDEKSIGLKAITIHVKAEHISIKVDKEEA